MGLSLPYLSFVPYCLNGVAPRVNRNSIETSVKQVVGTRQIKAARSLLAWSQADLARQSGVSEPTVARLEAADGELGGASRPELKSAPRSKKLVSISSMRTAAAREFGSARSPRRAPGALQFWQNEPKSPPTLAGSRVVACHGAHSAAMTGGTNRASDSYPLLVGGTGLLFSWLATASTALSLFVMTVLSLFVMVMPFAIAGAILETPALLMLLQNRFPSVTKGCEEPPLAILVPGGGVETYVVAVREGGRPPGAGARVTAALELARAHPSAKLLLSGAGEADPIPLIAREGIEA